MYKINHANIKDWAKNYDGPQFDGILCDPPYELGFMGKSWDSSGIAFDQEMWADLFRHIKPGGHLLAFSGSRTYHRMAVAIEDAGFEIRDMIEWVYGSGFPKSLNISKAIDKKGGYPTLTIEVADALKKARGKRGITKTQADKMFCGGTTLYSWYEGRPAGTQLPTSEYMRKIADAWPELEKYVGLTMEAEREVIGRHETDMGGLGGERLGQKGGDITVSATEQAKTWNGYGTALKPAHEPCVLARKPIEGTVANNVLKHGTGGLNIDGSRVSHEEPVKTATRKHRSAGWNMENTGFDSTKNTTASADPQGRFPANLIHDGSDEVEAVFPNDNQRFFYTSKASKSERNAGLEGFELRPGGSNAKGYTADVARGLDRNRPVANHHPTVKPLSLTKYLATLIKPPTGGRLLVPFSGSGSEMIGALQAGWEYVEGVELTEEYIPIAEARIKYWTSKEDIKQLELV